VPDPSAREPYPRPLIFVATGLALLLAVGVVVTSILLGSTDEGQPATPSTTPAAPRTRPIAMVPVDAPAAGSAECTTLIDALPNTLASAGNSMRRLPIAEPAPKATAAWGGDRGEPVLLRCGLPRPAELTTTAGLLEISGVKWLRLSGDGIATWYVVDRAVYLAVTVPEDAGTGPLQDLSATIRATLSAQPVRPG
jgi:uncharacterized protein DUF3515